MSVRESSVGRSSFATNCGASGAGGTDELLVLGSANTSAPRGGRGSAKEMSGSDVGVGGRASLLGAMLPQNWEVPVRRADISRLTGAADFCTTNTGGGGGADDATARGAGV